jgi:hypothetical protein
MSVEAELDGKQIIVEYAPTQATATKFKKTIFKQKPKAFPKITYVYYTWSLTFSSMKGNRKIINFST